MLTTALTLLVGDRVRFLGLIFGLAFSTLLVVQQGAIFRGVMTASYSYVTDAVGPQVWIEDPGIIDFDATNPLLEREIDRVRSVPGVAWATPLSVQNANLRLPDGSIVLSRVTGVDDATLIGAPGRLFAGSVQDLRRSWSCVVDQRAAAGKLRRDGRPLQVGDELQIKDRVIQVVGICDMSIDLLQMPSLFMLRSQVTELLGNAGSLNHILVGTAAGWDPERVAGAIAAGTGLSARTTTGVSRDVHDFFLFETGIPSNFAIAVLIGLIIGAAIVGQTFWQYVSDHRRIFATLKAMGLEGGRLVGILLIQAMAIAVVGWGLGLGCAALLGHFLVLGDLAFRLEPWLIWASFLLMLMISLAAPLVTLRSIIRIDPATVFRT